ncbi:hypothetical protein ACIBCN_36000 [Nocardia sp. NPDC051052]|uniref:hypothetical protein n=1 Tax=Nocardia sp. NPDC051052 TaxID=3364322 RepID=UPI0037AF4F9F
MAVVYLAALCRLAISENWNDVIAARLLGTSLCGAALVALLSLGPETGGSRKRWTKQSLITVVVVPGLILGGIVISIINTGTPWSDPMGQLLMETGTLACLLGLGWTPNGSRMR